MRAFGWILGVTLLTAVLVHGEDWRARAWELESKGDAASARELLEKAVKEGSSDTSVLGAYAEFLDRHRDPSARQTYTKLLGLLPPGQNAERAAVAKRLAVLDLLAGDRTAAEGHLTAYREAGGAALRLGDKAPAPKAGGSILIPGPLRSFARMAALAPDLAPDDLLGALARNVVTNGYQASGGNEGLDQTEYLKLVIRYLSQARELERISAADKNIKIETCDSPQTADLLRVLGYRMRGGCGSEVVLETVNATRAFITIDSGFPLADLEASLRANRPFVYNYQPTSVPVLYGPEYWLGAKDKGTGEFIDFFLSDPSMCRLYLGLSKLDPEAAAAMKEAIPVTRIKAYAHVLDFFGGMFQVRDGKAIVPGGARSEKAWADLAGANPDKGGAFFEKLIIKDDGWLASYFDALLRTKGSVLTYLTEPERMKRFYAALRGKVTSPGPARPVFRSNTDMMLLSTRMRVDDNGRPHVPGDIAVWKNLFINHPHGKYDGKLTKSAAGWKEPDDVIEALFGLCRKSVENEPLKIFMALTDINRWRAKPLEPATIDRLARDYRYYGSQYPILAELPSISDKSVIDFLDTADTLGAIREQGLRSDSIGSFQSLVSLLQILARQGSIGTAGIEESFAVILSHFEKVKNSRELFDAGRAGVKALLAATKAPAGVSAQDRLIDLMAGTASAEDTESHSQLVQDMIRIFEAQRLISLQTLFDLADSLEKVGKGEKVDAALVTKLAARISEIQLPRAQLSSLERNTLAFGYWTERHIEQQRKVNLRAAIDKAGADAEKMKDLRGLLAPFLRDTLVGLNYVHYAPPGAQILQTNPVFVRSHDFLGLQGANQTWKQTEVFGSGWPASAGGRLIGSLSGLPYALAEAEQNFLIPSREQALIWGDLVPQLILSAVVPRWWNVTPAQLHWVGLHMQFGESLIGQAALDANLCKQVAEVLDRYAPPARVRKIQDLLERGDVAGALEQVVPSEIYLLAAELSRNAPADFPMAGEINSMARQSPGDINYAAISNAFGTPKPTLANTYRPELLSLRTFPTLMGYSSRIMAESWESNLLYFAALADEVHMTPSQLNVSIPAWTQQTVERIFATHLEDWPALLRSLRTVGDDVRQKARKQTAAAAGGF